MILIAHGGNLETPYGSALRTHFHVRQTLAERGIRILKASRVWSTPHWPDASEPRHCNAVYQVETTANPKALLAKLQDVELFYGRTCTVKNAPRTLDLDVLAWHDFVSNDPVLTLPHSRIQERHFVLLPLRDVAPSWRHPVTGLKAQDMLDQLTKAHDCHPMEEDRGTKFKAQQKKNEAA